LVTNTAGYDQPLRLVNFKNMLYQILVWYCRYKCLKPWGRAQRAPTQSLLLKADLVWEKKRRFYPNLTYNH
jgi:hypothetical protein